MSLYLRFKNTAVVPRETVRNMLYGITYMYLRVLYITVYIIERISPSFEHLMNYTWNEMYVLAGKIIDFFEHANSDFQ